MPDTETTPFSFRLLSFRRQRINSEWNFQDVYSSFWRLYWNLEPGAAIHWGEGTLRIAGCQLCLLPAWFRFSCDCTGEIDHGFIHFEWVGCPSTVQKRVFREPLTNAMLAALCGMSEDHFIRVFRNAVGITPHAYLMNRRVREAARLLVFSRSTIEEIAEATGFSDRYHLTKVFTREMGRSPARYRREQPV